MKNRANRIKQLNKLLLRIMIAALGTIGILETIITCAVTSVESTGVIIFACIVSAIYVITLYKCYFLKMFILIPIGLPLIAVIMQLNLFLDGMAGIINDVIAVAKQSYSVSYDYIMIAGMDGQQLANSRIFALFILTAYIALFVSLNVTMTYGFLSSLLVVLPVLILFAGMNVVPDEVGLLCCAIFVFASSAIASEHTFRQPLKILLFSAVVLLIGICAFPKHTFHHLELFEQWNVALQTSVRRVVEQTGNLGDIATGGMNKGKLGTVDRVIFKNENMITVTTANLGKNQYFPVYIAKDYKDNAWNNGKDAWEDDARNITEAIVDFIENESQPKQLIGSSADTFYEDIYKYEYSMSLKDGKGAGNNTAYDVNLTGYASFAALMDTGEYDMNYADKMFNPYRVIRQREREYRKEAYEQYLDVPDALSEQITELIGKPQLHSAEDKQRYTNQVRQYLMDNYTYTTSPGRVPKDKDFITWFLMDKKEGYCTHFASAAVMMLRNAGIPARYVEGFALNKELIADGVAGNASILRYIGGNKKRVFEYEARTVTATDRTAHAWVEIYMDGYGWTTVEMTAGTATGGVSSLDYTGAFVDYSQRNEEQLEQQELQTEEQEETQQELETKESSVSTQDEALQEEENEKTGNVGSVMITFFLIFFVSISILYLLQRKRHYEMMVQKMILENDIVSYYVYLEYVLQLCGYIRAENMQYEDYAVWLQKNCVACKETDMLELIQAVLEERFQQAQQSTLQKKTIMEDMIEIHTQLIASMDKWKYLRLILHQFN